MSAKPEDMRAALSFSRIGAAYGISGQAARQLSIRHGIDRETLTIPDLLLVALLDRGNKSPLRSKLVDPSTRNAIASQLQTTESNDPSCLHLSHSPASQAESR